MGMRWLSEKSRGKMIQSEKESKWGKWERAVIIESLDEDRTWEETGAEINRNFKFNKPLKLFPFEQDKALIFTESMHQKRRLCEFWEEFHQTNEILVYPWNPDINKLEGEKAITENHCWVRVKGVPFNEWNERSFNSIGDLCGGLISISPLTSSGEDLSMMRFRVKGPLPDSEWVSTINIGDETCKVILMKEDEENQVHQKNSFLIFHNNGVEEGGSSESMPEMGGRNVCSRCKEMMATDDREMVQASRGQTSNTYAKGNKQCTIAEKMREAHVMASTNGHKDKGRMNVGSRNPNSIMKENRFVNTNHNRQKDHMEDNVLVGMREVVSQRMRNLGLFPRGLINNSRDKLRSVSLGSRDYGLKENKVSEIIEAEQGRLRDVEEGSAESLSVDFCEKAGEDKSKRKKVLNYACRKYVAMFYRVKEVGEESGIIFPKEDEVFAKTLTDCIKNHGSAFDFEMIWEEGEII